MAVKAESGFRWDYLEHFLAFFTFGSLYVIWRSDRNYHMRGTELFVLLIASGGFSFAMEYAQLYVPGRAFNPIDLTCNLAGVLGSILFVYFYLIRHYLRKRYVMPGGWIKIHLIPVLPRYILLHGKPQSGILLENQPSKAGYDPDALFSAGFMVNFSFWTHLKYGGDRGAGLD
jgi:hypothetical protein